MFAGSGSFLRIFGIESTADVLFALYDTAIPEPHRELNKLFEAAMPQSRSSLTGTSMDIIVSRYQCGM